MLVEIKAQRPKVSFKKRKIDYILFYLSKLFKKIISIMVLEFIISLDIPHKASDLQSNLFYLKASIFLFLFDYEAKHDRLSHSFHLGPLKQNNDQDLTLTY
jgi:hypothetical protein